MNSKLRWKREFLKIAAGSPPVWMVCLVMGVRAVGYFWFLFSGAAMLAVTAIMTLHSLFKDSVIK